MLTLNRRKFRASILVNLAVVVAAASGACSLEAPKPGNGIKIIIDDPNKNAALAAPMFNTFDALTGGHSLFALTGPTATSDFTCFAVNVTGAGVPTNSQKLQGCTSPTNMRGTGVGAISDTTPRGTPVTLAIPAGTSRTIDVYGVFPPDQSNCGGATGSSGSSGGSNGGFFLGRTVADLAADTTVTVGISYAGAPADVTCTNNNGGNSQTLQIFSPFPYGGRNTGGWTSTINGSGFLSTALVTIGGTACTSQTINSTSNISCTVPALGAGTYSVNVDNQNGTPSVTSGAFFQIVSATAFVSVDKNTNLLDFGNVTSGQTKDIAVAFSSNGAGSPPSFNSIASINTALSSAQIAVVSGSSTCPFGISFAPDASCIVTLRFSPSSTGVKSASNVVFTSGGTPASFTTIQGTGI